MAFANDEDDLVDSSDRPFDSVSGGSMNNTDDDDLVAEDLDTDSDDDDDDDDDGSVGSDPPFDEFRALFHHRRWFLAGPGRSMEDVDVWLEKRPHLAFTANRQGWLLLHYAAFWGFSADVMRCISRHFPHMASHASEREELPLHVARIEAEEDLEVLVDLNVPALRQKDNDGDLPLHTLMRRLNAPGFGFGYLARQWPQAVREMAGNGELPLNNIVGHVEETEELMDLIRLCVHLWPGALGAKDRWGCTPLACALSILQPSEVITYLAEAHPGALRERDNEGRPPLHITCPYFYSRARIDEDWTAGVIRMVELYPEAVQERSDNGELPIHKAARLESMTFMRCLVARYPESIRCKANDGALPLHRAAASTRSDEARYLVRLWPESVRETAAGGLTPLHVAAGYDEPDHYFDSDASSMMHLRLDTIRFFVSEWPDALLQASDDGQPPLHCAARAGTLETVEFLVQQSPGSVRVATADGCVPLHCAAEANDARVCDDDEDWPEERRSVLRYLFRQWPEAIRLPCHQGFLPLHYAAKRLCSVPTLKFLVEQHPESVSAPSADGSLPVHLAVSRDIPKLRIVRFLVRSMPESLLVPTNDGSLPLHVALAQKEPSRKIVRFLVEQSPGALLVANASGSLPLHLALSSATCKPTLVRKLVEEHPETLQATDRDGLLPFQIAAANDAPLDLVFYLVAKWPAARRVEEQSEEPRQARKNMICQQRSESEKASSSGSGSEKGSPSVGACGRHG